MKTGRLRANAIAVASFEVSFLNTSVDMKAKAVILDTESRRTHGWTQNQNWSPATMKKLEELKEAMEEDFATGLFQQDGGKTGFQVAGSTEKREEGEPGGLGEHLSGQASKGSVDAEPA